MRHPAFPARASSHRNVSLQAVTRESEDLGMLGTVKKASSAIREGRPPIFFRITAYSRTPSRASCGEASIAR